MPDEIVITGGQGDLAQVISQGFNAAGHLVEAPGRDVLDVSSEDSVRAYFSKREPDLLICNAGQAEDALLALMGEEQWDRVLDVNLDGAWRCAKAVAKAMAKRRRGHIVFIGSYSGVHPPVGQAAYAAAKAGLQGLMMSLARELGPRNVRVNLVLPGFLETKMTAGLSDDRKRAVLSEHCLDDFNTADAVARFLRVLHDEMPATSGQVFNLDSRIL